MTVIVENQKFDDQSLRMSNDMITSLLPLNQKSEEELRHIGRIPVKINTLGG